MDRRNITYFPCMCLFCVLEGCKQDDRPAAFMCSPFTMSSANLINSSKPYLLPNPVQCQPHHSPLPSCRQRSHISRGAVPPSPRPLQCPSLQWPASARTISLPLRPPPLSSLEMPLSCQGTSRLHICLEGCPVCVRLKLTLKLIQFFLPITHPPLLPQLRLICHINPFNLGKFQVQFLLFHSIPASYFTLFACKTIPVPSNAEVTIFFSTGACQMPYEQCYTKINCITQYSTLLICKNDVTC